MSTFRTYAAIAAAGFLAGRLSARSQRRQLRVLLHDALDRADHDSLTGLPNRRLVPHLFTRHQQHGQPTVVALLDLDRFKAVNDTYGHLAGDQLLRVTGQRILTVARAHGGTAARLGGDEFVVLLPGTDAGVDAILHTIARPVTVSTARGDRLLQVQASAGSTVSSGTGSIAAQLHQADIALYQAKQQPGGHRQYRPDMRMPDTAPPGARIRDRHVQPADGAHR